MPLNRFQWTPELPGSPVTVAVYTWVPPSGNVTAPGEMLTLIREFDVTKMAPTALLVLSATEYAVKYISYSLVGGGFDGAV